jgi:hypothetical protein
MIISDQSAAIAASRKFETSNSVCRCRGLQENRFLASSDIFSSVTMQLIFQNKRTHHAT